MARRRTSGRRSTFQDDEYSSDDVDSYDTDHIHQMYTESASGQDYETDSTDADIDRYQDGYQDGYEREQGDANSDEVDGQPDNAVDTDERRKKENSAELASVGCIGRERAEVYLRPHRMSRLYRAHVLV